MLEGRSRNSSSPPPPSLGVCSAQRIVAVRASIASAYMCPTPAQARYRSDARFVTSWALRAPIWTTPVPSAWRASWVRRALIPSLSGFWVLDTMGSVACGGANSGVRLVEGQLGATFCELGFWGPGAMGSGACGGANSGLLRIGEGGRANGPDIRMEGRQQIGPDLPLLRRRWVSRSRAHPAHRCRWWVGSARDREIRLGRIKQRRHHVSSNSELCGLATFPVELVSSIHPSLGLRRPRAHPPQCLGRDAVVSFGGASQGRASGKDRAPARMPCVGARRCHDLNGLRQSLFGSELRGER